MNNLLQLNVTKVEQCGSGYEEQTRMVVHYLTGHMQGGTMSDLRQHIP